MTRRTNTVLFLLMLFATLVTPWDSRKWTEFSDTADYLKQSQIPLDSREFWSPHHSGSFYPRPFTVPLLYKLAGSDPARIVLMQKFVHCLSTWFLVFALLLLVSARLTKYLLMGCIYLLMSWWTITGWTNQVLSESLSLSMLFCWIASFILAWQKRSWYFWLLHILFTVLLSFTRDSWPYLLIVFYLAVLIVSWIWERPPGTTSPGGRSPGRHGDKARLVSWISERTLAKSSPSSRFHLQPLAKSSLLMILVSAVIFTAQVKTAQTGQRYRLPMLNTLAVRIAGEKNYLQWFKDHGMPCADSLAVKYKAINVNLDTDRHRIWDLYYNRNYKSLWNWILEHGQGAYMKFMLTHPSYTLLFRESKSQRQRIFAFDLWYSGESAGYSRYVSAVFPIFSPWWLLACNIFLLIQFFRRKKLILLFPVILSLVFIANVFLSYNADALEVERHLFITVIMIQMLVFLSLALLGDTLNGLLTNKLQK